MARRRTFLSTAGTGIALSLAGCISFGGGDDTDENAEVHFLTFNSGDSFQNYFDNVAAEFEEETGIPVNMEYVGGFTVLERLTTLVQAGNPPTIFSAPPSGAGGQMWIQGNTEPVTDIVEEFQEMYGTIADRFRFPPIGNDDHVIPHYRIAWGMEWFRTDVYNDGLGETWDDYRQTFEENDSNELRAAWVPGGPAGFSGRFLNTLAAAAGNEMVRFENEPEYVVDQFKDGWVETLEFIGDIHQYSNTNAEASYVEAGQAIPNEEGAWVAHAGRTGLTAVREEIEFRDQLALSAPPGPDGEPAITSLINVSATGIISSDMVDEARVENSKEFLRFMYGLRDEDEQRYIDFVNADPFHYFPITDDFLSNEQYRNSEPFQEYPILGDYLDQMIEKNLEKAAMGSEFGMAQPFWGVMDGSEGLAEMAHDYLIVDKSAEQAFDDNEPTLRKAYDDTLKQLQEEGIL